MKKFLSILGSITVFGSGVLTFSAVQPKITNNNLSNQFTNEVNQDSVNIIDTNINSLTQIDKELVLESLVEVENNVVMNYELFLDKNLTNDFINLMKNFQLANISINDAKQLLFSETKEVFATSHSIGDWKVYASKPKVWYEWIGGVWRLEFNHNFIQDIIYGIVTLSDLIGIVGEAGIYASAAIVASAIFLFASWALDNADLGNGVLFRFSAWTIPTKITNSTHNWN